MLLLWLGTTCPWGLLRTEVCMHLLHLEIAACCAPLPLHVTLIQQHADKGLFKALVYWEAGT